MPFMTLGTEIMTKSIQLTAALCSLCSSITMAGTIIDIQTKNQMTTVLTDGQLSRLNMGEGEFVLVNHKSQQLMMVNSHKHEIMLFDSKQISANSNGPKVRTAVKLIGAEINIAGYKTNKYEYSANGKFCGVIYGSKTVYQVEGVKELFSAMKMLMDRQQAILGGLASMLDVCTLADMKLSDRVTTIGVPMRSEKNGYVDTEVKNIQVGVDIPGYIFEVPASYRIVTMPGQTKNVAIQLQK